MSVELQRLHPADLERLADLVADRLAERLDRGAPPASDLVDVRTLAGILNTSPAFVYEHADELGAVRLGDGSRARLRFDIEQARQAMVRRPDPPLAPLRRRQRKLRTATSSGVPLLPIRGHAE